MLDSPGNGIGTVRLGFPLKEPVLLMDKLLRVDDFIGWLGLYGVLFTVLTGTLFETGAYGLIGPLPDGGIVSFCCSGLLP